MYLVYRFGCIFLLLYLLYIILFPLFFCPNKRYQRPDAPYLTSCSFILQSEQEISTTWCSLPHLLAFFVVFFVQWFETRGSWPASSLNKIKKKTVTNLLNMRSIVVLDETTSLTFEECNSVCKYFFIKWQPHRWCKGYCARLECGRSWVHRWCNG